MAQKVKRVVCGISGGVDSAVAADILKKKGYEVIGLFMKNWDIRDEKGECLADKDRVDAKYVCNHLQIPLYEVNFVKEYWNNVFSSFVQDYKTGMIPNPDVLCNKYIKFGAFFDYAINMLEADAVATGHYARTSFGYDLDSVDPEKGVKLLKAVDEVKDQTFFMSQIQQKALQKSLFPLGGKLKTHVKKYAESIGLEKIARKKESMGICFIGKRNFASFIDEYIEQKEGTFVDVETNQVIGKHKGTHHYTYGQNIALQGMNHSYFVVDIDSETQTVRAAPGSDHPALYAQSFFTGEPYWIHDPPRDLIQEGRCDVDFRFQKTQKVVQCTCKPGDGNSLKVSLAYPKRALTPGQFAVFYRDDECLGSATILRIGPSLFTLNYEEFLKNQSMTH